MMSGIVRSGFAALAVAFLPGFAVLADPPSTPPAAAASSPSPASSPAPTVPLALLTARDFGRLPFAEDVTLSPDGTKIAGLMGLNGRQVIALINLIDHADHPIRVALPDGNEAHWLRWVNNDNVIVGVSALLPVETDRWVISRLISINRLTGKITRILWNAGGQNAADLLWVAKDGSPQIMVAAQQSIYAVDAEFWPTAYKVNVETGRETQVTPGRGGVMEWSSDAEGTVRAGVGYEDSTRRFRLFYRSTRGQGFRVIDSADSKKQEELTSPFLFLPGTDHALAIHDNDKGHSAIYEVDLNTGQDVREVYEAPDGLDVTQPIVSADGTTLLGAWLSDTGYAVHWFDHDLATVQDSLNKAVSASGGRRAAIISLSDDRQRMLVLVDRPDSPGAIYFFDTAGDRLALVSLVNPDLGSRPLAQVKLVDYTARDGTPIEAVMTLPRDRPQRNLPVVMLPHGGPWAHDGLYYDYWAQFIATRGYAVIQPNFRGSTGYGTAFERAGQGQMGLAMQDDITDGLKWAVDQGIVDAKRACIVGASYGGYAAMWGIAKDPDLYRCAISIAGVSNVRRDVNDFGEFLLGSKYIDDWKRMSSDFAAISPINAVDRIKVPLLLIHGRKDVTVDYNQSQKMYDRMKGAGKQVELIALDQADHHFTREPDRIALLTSIERFLAAHNPPDPVPGITAPPK